MIFYQDLTRKALGYKLGAGHTYRSTAKFT